MKLIPSLVAIAAVTAQLCVAALHAEWLAPMMGIA